MPRTWVTDGARLPSARTRRSRAVAIAGLAAIGLLAACGGGGPQGGADNGEVTVTTLRVDVQSEPDTLDPIAYNDITAQRIYRLTYDALYAWDEESTDIVPRLAVGKPELNDDRSVYTVKLRDDVTWHDGSSFTADDVVFTYQQVANVDNASVWQSHIGALDQVVKIDDTTVEFRLQRPYTYFPEKLAMVPIISKQAGYTANENLSREMLGTGPFAFVSWDQGEQITLERNENYYGETPALEGVEFHIVPEDTTRVANLRNGTTHIVPDLPPALIESVERGGQHAEAVPENVSRSFLYPNVQDGRPTADPLVRQAISWAIDRGSIVDTVYDGTARPASTYLSYGSQYHDEELGQHYGDEANPEESEQLLSQAKTPPTEPLNLVVTNIPALVDTATILERNLSEVGIEVEIEPLNYPALVPRLQAQEYDLLLIVAPVTGSAGFAPDYPAIGLHSESVANWNQFGDPEMDTLLETAQEAPRGEDAEAAWRAVQELDLTTLGQIQLVSVQYVEGYSTGLGDYEPSKVAWLDNIPTIGAE